MSELKKNIYQNKVLSKTVIPIYLALKKKRNFTSSDYWEDRYRGGGNSGSGSYGRLAKFKADTLNNFVNKNKLKTVLELGCGDGNQIKYFKFPNYIGFDVSRTSIQICQQLFKKEKTKSFFLYDPLYFTDKHNIFSVDVTISLDVIYHLVEDSVFEKYMHDLFALAKKYVVVYSSDIENPSLSRAQHVRHRNFTEWINQNINGWKLERQIKNKHTLSTNHIDESFADFYIYKKVK